MTTPRARGFIRIPTVSGVLAIALGLAFVASGATAAAFVGVLLLVAGGVELALDFEETLVPDRVSEISEPAVPSAEADGPYEVDVA